MVSGVLPPRARRSQLLTTLVAIAFAVATLSAVGNFALPYGGHGRPGARDKLKETYELPREAPAEPEPELQEALPTRTPYTISLYTPAPQDGHSELSADSREYILEKVHAALHNTRYWVKSVEVRVRQDHNSHKASQEVKVTDFQANEDSDVAYPYQAMRQKKREIVPFTIEATVRLADRSVVLSANPKHAQATLTEAADHMYDFLRRQMRKEKERRIDRARKQSEEGVYDASAETDALREADEKVLSQYAQSVQAEDVQWEELYGGSNK